MCVSHEMGAAGPGKKSREGLIWGAKKKKNQASLGRQKGEPHLSSSTGHALSVLGVGGIGQVGAELHPASP